MPRLIDADVITDWLLQEIRARDGAFCGLLGWQAANMIGKRIDEIPTVGETTRPVFNGRFWECEECGHEYSDILVIKKYKFCPWCGRRIVWNV